MLADPLKLVTSVVFLPVRIGLGLARAVAEAVREPEPSYPEAAEEPAAGAAPASEPPSPVRPAPPRVGVRDRPQPEPVHVSEEPELVGKYSDAAADAEPGPEISVEEPWDGYDRMKASDVRRRLAAGGPEVAAAVRLYEGERKRRATVMRAAEEQLGA